MCKIMTIKNICQVINVPFGVAYRLFIPMVQWTYAHFSNAELRGIKFIGNGTNVIIRNRYDMSSWGFMYEDYLTLIKRFRTIDDYTKESIDFYISKYYNKTFNHIVTKKDNRTCLFPHVGYRLQFTGTISNITKRTIMDTNSEMFCISFTNVTSSESPNIKIEHINILVPKCNFYIFKEKLYIKVGDKVNFNADVISYKNDQHRYGICRCSITRNFGPSNSKRR